jgi:hypothetical protein
VGFGRLNLSTWNRRRYSIRSDYVSRVYTPHLPAKIPSLKDLVDGNVDEAVQIPSQLPTETPKSELVNSHQIRYSDTPIHDNLHSNIVDSKMRYTRYPFPNSINKSIEEKYGANAPFRDCEVIREWVEDIFVRNGNNKFLELNTTVELVEKKHGKWVLTLRKELPS